MKPEIAYHYIKQWDWYDKAEAVRYPSNLVSGSVHRVLQMNGVDMLFIGISSQGIDTIPLTIPKEESNVRNLMEFETVKITKKNLLDLPLTEQHLDQILLWESNKNKDITSLFEQDKMEVPEEVTKAIQKTISDYTSDMMYAGESIEELYNVNKGQFDIVVELTDHINEVNMSEDDAASFIAKGTRGLGLNIADAIRSLSAYASGPKYGEERTQLLDAMISIIKELERRDILQLD